MDWKGRDLSYDIIQRFAWRDWMTTRNLSQDSCCMTRFESGTLPVTTKNSIHSTPNLSVAYVEYVTVNAKEQRTYYLWYSITDV